MAYTNKTKDHILKCAKSVFLKNGYAETTIRGIAKEAGTSPSNIYTYFKSKKLLFEALDIPEVADLHPEYDKKRAAILHTALLLFGERGFNGVTMDDIANAQNLSKTTLYLYFKSKEDLFSNILQSSSFNLYTKSIATDSRHPDIHEVIKSIGKSYLQIGSSPERSALFKTVIKDSSMFPELGRLYYEQGIKPACENIVKYIELHCKENKRPMKDSNTLLSFILTYIGSLQSYILMHDIIHGFPDTMESETYLNMTTDVFLNYLKQNSYI